MRSDRPRPAGHGEPAGAGTPAPGELAPSAPRGLTADEVAARVTEGRVNAVPSAPVRTLGEIVKANVLTWVNAIIGVLFGLVMLTGRWADGLFIGVVLTNSVIGIVQELRARHTLHELEVVSTPTVRVLRDGVESEIASGDVVADDLLLVSSGDQFAVDGEVVESGGLEVDESMLTGEADPEHKEAGDEVLSGSFVVAGSGLVRATKVGAGSYASTLAEQARRFQLVPSGLRADVDRVLRWQILIIPPVAVLLLIRQWSLLPDWRDAVIDTVAASAAMVPAGLALLISIAFMVGVVNLARRKALAKELASVELLARVDTLCLDKTGTITTGEITFCRADAIGDADDAWLAAALSTLVAADPEPNPTLRAIAHAHGDAPAWEVASAVPFSSLRKWAAVRAPDHGSVYLGAPEVLLAGVAGDRVVTRTRELVRAGAEAGQRVLVVVRCDAWEGDRLPAGVRPAGVVVLEDTVRPDAGEIFSYFLAQDVTLKVISGDNPRTVSTVAARAGVPDSDRWVDARDLPEDTDKLADELDRNGVFGRVSPYQKRSMVRALQSRGHVVAMTGDGVNDVLALKESDAGIAMGAGSPASRAVAQLVLLDNRFATLPVALAEGRKVINNIERVANLFLTKTAYAVTMALLVGLAGSPFPFLPRQQTLVDTFSIGLPGLVLALAPATQPIRRGLLHRVLMFAVPSGVVAGTVCFSLFTAVSNRPGSSLDEARTAATFALLGVALAVLVLASRPLTLWKVGLAGTMLGLYVAITTIEPLRRFFMLSVPEDPAVRWQIVAAAAAGGAAVVAIRIVTDRIERRRAANDDGAVGPAP